METKTIELSEAQRQLADLVAQAAAGTEIVLTEDNTPRARLVAMTEPGGRRVPGLHPGSMKASDDFDAPLADEATLVSADPVLRSYPVEVQW